MKCDKKSLLLYAVTDRTWLNGESLYKQVEKAIKGGVTFLQLREKKLDEENFMKEALEIQKLCKEIPPLLTFNFFFCNQIYLAYQLIIQITLLYSYRF